MAYERIIIVGNLGGNPELRTTKDAQQVANFSIAVNRKKGETKTTTWYRVSAWNGNADLAAKYLKKGNRVMVEGSGLRVNVYIDKSGSPQATLELTVDRLIFLDSTPDAVPNGEADSAEMPF